jgi:hypothetical protein
VIIFGWGGGKAKNHGPAVPQVCPSCGHDGFFNYFTVTKWLRLYFIPIIPYNTRHFLACPACTAGTELNSAAERQRVHALVAATASLSSGLIGPDAYGEQMRSGLGQAAPTPALPPAPEISRPGKQELPSGTANRIRAGESWSG